MSDPELRIRMEKPIAVPHWWFEGPTAQREGFSEMARKLFAARQPSSMLGVTLQQAAKHKVLD